MKLHNYARSRSSSELENETLQGRPVKAECSLPAVGSMAYSANMSRASHTSELQKQTISGNKCPNNTD